MNENLEMYMSSEMFLLILALIFAPGLVLGLFWLSLIAAILGLIVLAGGGGTLLAILYCVTIVPMICYVYWKVEDWWESRKTI
jgi:hypothetical protein